MFTRPVNDIIGTSCARVMSPLIQDRHFRTLARCPFTVRCRPWIGRPAVGPQGGYFYRMSHRQDVSQYAHSTIKVLDHCGVGIYLPDNQGCCGIPALSSGDLPTFQKLLAHNLRAF
jgi:glycolate oxidase iron-sulfur subunit